MAKAKPKKSKGLLGRAASLLGSIPAVGNVRNAAKKVGKAKKTIKKTVKKATKTAKRVVKSSKKKVKKTVKKTKKKAAKFKKGLKKAKKKVKRKAKKKLRKKVGKVFTKARKLKNNLSKNKRVQKLKKQMKKTVLKAKKGIKKAKSTAKKVSKAVVKDSKKIMKKATLGARAIGEFTKNGFNGREVASAIVDFIPIVGNAKGAYEATFGKDPITGRKLDKTERAIAGASILLGGGFKGGTKVVSGAISGGKKAAGKVSVPKGNVTPKVNYGEHYTKEKRKKVLKSDIEYTTPQGHTYKTDNKGRIVNCEATLELEKGKRNNHAQKVAGRGDRKPDDDGGHLIATIFNGSGGLDNLVPMNSNLNRGEWKKLENIWAKELGKGKSVEVKMQPIYKGDSQRPVSFEIEHKIGNGDWEYKEFKNKPGGK